MLSPGQRIDHFEIIKLLGNGKIADVYLAQDTILNREVALKLNISDGLALVNEARTMVLINAPHTAKVLSVGTHDSHQYAIYELMQHNLRDEIISHGKLGWKNVLRTFLRIAETVDHLHRRGYVYGDIRPRNIMYDKRGLAFLSDMSLVRYSETHSWQEALAFANMQPARVKYAPPEAKLGADDYALDPSFDIWSIGLVLYEALTGESLVQTPEQLREEGFDVNFERPSQTDVAIPAIFDQICELCLVPEPSGRLTSGELLDHLRRVNESERPFKPKVFISHSTKDRDFVEKHIVGLLESNGIATWYSKVSIQSASEWERSILNGLEQSSWFLVVMSESSAQSEWVKDEVFWAIDHRKSKIIPVLKDQVEMSDFHIRLRRIQAVDLRVDADVHNQKIIDILEATR